MRFTFYSNMRLTGVIILSKVLNKVLRFLDHPGCLLRLTLNYIMVIRKVSLCWGRHFYIFVSELSGKILPFETISQVQEY